MFYTYICYFQYKHNVQITFHVQKQFHARVTSKDLFTLHNIISFPISVLSRFCFISLNSPPPSLVN